MKILITGIAGFVGSSIAERLLKQTNFKIIGIDNLSSGYIERLSDLRDQIDFINDDVINIDKSIKIENIDLVIHCAAIAPLPECQKNSYHTITENVSKTGSIIDFMLKRKIQNLIFFSSGAIYEGTTIFPTPENIDISPKLLYPMTKYMSEIYLKGMSSAYNINIISLRLFNLYGPRQDYFRKQPPLLGYLIKQLYYGKTAELFSNGEQRRDYLYIDDLIDLINLSILYLQEIKPGRNYLALNAGSGKHYSVNDLIRILENTTGKKIDINRNDSINYWNKYPELFNSGISLNSDIVESEVNKFTLADIENANKIMGWRPRVSINQGIAECYEFAVKNL